MFRKTLVIAAAAAAMLTPTVAHAEPAPDASACKDGGYVSYIDPATDQPFTNQGQCVSFVRAGGTLVPVEEEPPAVTVTFVQWYLFEQSDPDCMLLWRIQGEPGAQVTYEAPSYPEWNDVYTLPPDGVLAGTLYGYSPPVPSGSTVVLVINGQEYVTPAADC